MARSHLSGGLGPKNEASVSDMICYSSLGTGEWVSESNVGNPVNLPDIEVATFFQHIFEPPTDSHEGRSWRKSIRDSQEATAEASCSSSSGVHGMVQGLAEDIPVRKTEKKRRERGDSGALSENDHRDISP